MNERNNLKQNQPASIGHVYDQIAESFDLKRKYPWKEVINFIDSLSSDNLVLDLGCGNGRHSSQLLQRNHTVICSDISYKILQIALQNELKNYRNVITGIVNADGLCLPFHKDSFDTILSIAVIHHLSTETQRTNFLKEIYRTLRSKGTALISCWLRTHPRFSKKDLANEILAGKKEIYVPWTMQDERKIIRYYYLFDPEELEKLVKSIGFKINNSEISNHNLFLTITKE
ncbi:MAG TPA: methyltransferase domain-containing protein [Candidatus Bathyarchaeia archaeon]|nr:methyltransferase domain-containing protein [Candidatus Bathyarchaeia archaeon]